MIEESVGRILNSMHLSSTEMYTSLFFSFAVYNFCCGCSQLQSEITINVRW